MTGATAAREPALAGQTVVVIGGSAGIGRETARLARAEGADVILTGRDPGRLELARRAGGLPEREQRRDAATLQQRELSSWHG